MNLLFWKKKTGRSQELEKRIFISYFVVTIILIIILLIIEWRLAKFGIMQHEDIKLKNSLTEFTIEKNLLLLNLFNTVNNFAEDEKITDLISKKQFSKIGSLLQNELRTMVIINRNLETIAGVSWDLTEKYKHQIFRDAAQNNAGSFIGMLGNRLYLIAYSPILSNDKSEMPAVCILSRFLSDESIVLKSSPRFILTTFEFPISFAKLSELENLTNRITERIQFIKDKHSGGNVFRINRDLAIGIELFYDLEEKPTGFFLVSYPRFENSFVQQSILFFILILLAISLIMISLTGSWFSRSILAPVNQLNEKMKSIAGNPGELGIYKKKYTGVLGEMVDSFNKMNLSLTDYSKTLHDYKLILDNIDSGIFWLDQDFRVQLANPGFSRLLNYSEPQKIIGQNLSKLLRVDIDLKGNVMAGNDTFPSLKINPAENITKYVILNIRADKLLQDLRFFGSITDITKETQAVRAKEALEIELIRSNKLAEIGKNIEGIVHNLNSPLNSVLGYSQLIQRNHPEVEDIKKILSAGKVAAKMVKGLLDNIKKKNIGMITPIQVNELIEQELDLCQHNLFFKHFVILEKDLKDIPLIRANYGDLGLCLSNIFNNAFDAMEKSTDKVLRITTDCVDNSIIIRISDTGCGIAPANIDKIFDAYFSTKKNNRATGFGLGLAIAKNIILNLGGSIKVESKVNEGTEFTINLPLTEKV